MADYVWLAFVPEEEEFSEIGERESKSGVVVVGGYKRIDNTKALQAIRNAAQASEHKSNIVASVDRLIGSCESDYSGWFISQSAVDELSLQRYAVYPEEVPEWLRD